jgi:hypothetical protein
MAAGFDNYGFVVSRYKLLKSGETKWSSSMRDYQKIIGKGERRGSKGMILTISF